MSQSPAAGQRNFTSIEFLNGGLTCLRPHQGAILLLFRVPLAPLCSEPAIALLGRRLYL